MSSETQTFRCLSKPRERMEAHYCSFCSASPIWSRSHKFSLFQQHVICPPKLDKAAVHRTRTNPASSVCGRTFAVVENNYGYPGDVSLSDSNLALRMALAKEKSRRSVPTDPTFSSPLTVSDASDIPQTGVDRTCVIQDLKVPDSPNRWGLPVWEVSERIQSFLRERDVPIEKRDQLEKDATLLLAAVRGWTAQLADSARQILSSNNAALRRKQELQHVDALIILLRMAGFSVLPELPKTPDPPNPDALSLGNSIEKTLDPTILQGSTVAEEHIRRNETRLGSASYYPHLFIATRGVTVVRRSGLLLPQKLRAIERSCFSLIRSPLLWLLESPILKLFNVRNTGFGTRNADDASQVSKLNCDAAEVTATSQASTSDHRETVRRIVPAVQLARTWESLHRFFSKSFTQEPAHELLVLLYREVILDKATILRERRKLYIDQIKESLSQAINPLPPGRKKAEEAAMRARASLFDGFQKSSGETKPVSLMIFADVPWGTTDHFFPSTFVLPATRDLLRIDALTFTALLSALVTYLRNAENVFVYAFLIASVTSYCARVVLGLRQALVTYRGRIASQKVKSLMSQQRGCFDLLAELSAEEMFVDAACVWLSSQISPPLTAQQLQLGIFHASTLTDETVDLWEHWLHHNGFKRSASQKDLSVSSDRVVME